LLQLYEEDGLTLRLAVQSIAFMYFESPLQRQGNPDAAFAFYFRRHWWDFPAAFQFLQGETESL
jgi:hypothetical protein